MLMPRALAVWQNVFGIICMFMLSYWLLQKVLYNFGGGLGCVVMSPGLQEQKIMIVRCVEDEKKVSKTNTLTLNYVKVSIV